MAQTANTLGGSLRRLIDAVAVEPEERRLAGRTCGWLFALGGITLSSFLVLPGLSHVDRGWLLIVAADALAWGLLQTSAIRWERAPTWLIHLSVAWSFVLIAGAVASTGGATSPAWTYLFFVVVFVAYFFPRRAAYVYLAACVCIHVLPLLYSDHTASTQFFPEFAIAAPAYVLFGVAILAGKDLMTSLRVRAEELAARQSSLRRVATAVVDGRPDHEIYALVAGEMAELFRCDSAAIMRLTDDNSAELLGSCAHDEKVFKAGAIFPLSPAMEEMVRTGVAVLNDAPERDSLVGRLGYRVSLAAPISVGGEIWGLLSLTAREAGAIGVDDVQKLSEFADLLSTAITSLEDKAKLAARASSDPLTGLGNHRTLQERLTDEIARAIRHHLPLSVAVLDLDQFKMINDIAGHEAGDAMLVALSGCMRAMARTEDILCRIGGDEFAWVMPETRREQALLAVERVRAQLSLSTTGPYRVTVSAGICDLAATTDPAELLRLADGALYWSKAHGRDQCWTYDADVIEELSAQQRAEHLERSQALLGLRALAGAIDAKDPAHRAHSERVAGLAARLAGEAGWPPERAKLLSEAALVHDVGKIGIPDALLRKTSPLTPEEREQVEHHAELSARIVEGVLTPEQVDWIRMHHERPDGKGYPRGLAGTEILQGAGLLSLADAFDVMTVSRPDSIHKSIPEAVQEIRGLAERQFTAQAVAALMALDAKGELAPKPEQSSNVTIA